MDSLKDSDVEDHYMKLLTDAEELNVQITCKNEPRFNVTGSVRRPWLYWLLMMVLWVLGLNLLLFRWDAQILGVCLNMFSNINSLMDSENIVLESYLDLKSQLIVNYSEFHEASISDKILREMNQSEVTFNKIISESLTLFTTYDPLYQSDMIELLVNNLCEL